MQATCDPREFPVRSCLGERKDRLDRFETTSGRFRPPMLTSPPAGDSSMLVVGWKSTKLGLRSLAVKPDHCVRVPIVNTAYQNNSNH